MSRAMLLARLAVVLALSATVTSSCRTERAVAADWRWVDVADLVKQDAKDDDAAAVVVLRDHRLLFQRLGKWGDSRAELHSHEVIRVLSEAGFERALVRLAWPKKGRLVHLDARTIAPDGTVTPLDAEAAFASSFQLDEEKSGDARAFSFPRVDVGSWLELSYTIELDGFYTAWSDRVTDEIPVREYRLDIVVDDIAQPELRVLNHPAQPTVTLEADGMRHLRLQLKDIPAAVDEPFSPTWRARDPWWIYRTVRYRYPNDEWDLEASWSDAARATSKLVVKHKGLEQAPALDLARCGQGTARDTRCVIDAALAETHRRVVFTGFAPAFALGEVDAVVAAGAADAGGKAALLFALLTNAGVDARLAAVARRGTNEVARDFPSLRWLNHTLVVAVMGDQAVWMDPSCEMCASGTLPSWDPIGADALVVSKKGDKLTASWWALNGQPAPHDNVLTSLWTLTVDERGDARVLLEQRSAGEASLFWRARTRNDVAKDAADDAQRLVRRLSPAATVTSHTPVTCARNTGRCQQRIEAVLPRFAHQDVDGLRVPLSLLRPAVDLVSRRPRRQDYVVSAPLVHEDELTVVPPKGYTIAAPPRSRSGKGALGAVEIAAEVRSGTLVVKRTTRELPGHLPVTSGNEAQAPFEPGAALAASVVRLVPPR